MNFITFAKCVSYSRSVPSFKIVEIDMPKRILMWFRIYAVVFTNHAEVCLPGILICITDTLLGRVTSFMRFCSPNTTNWIISKRFLFYNTIHAVLFTNHGEVCSLDFLIRLLGGVTLFNRFCSPNTTN